MGTSVIVAALPALEERVNQISSEDAPHMTILFFGEDPENVQEIVEFVQHATKELSPFYLPVDHRGTLGEDEADVIFFEDNRRDMKRVKDFRHHLLLNDTVRKAYDSVEQYPEWTPHLTLGYPATPAKPDDSDHPGIHGVLFDRIAVWIEDSDGPEFRLRYDDDYALEGSVAMSDTTTAERGAMAIAELFHYGKKGMKWGVRKADQLQEQADEAAAKGKTTKAGKLEAKRDKALSDADKKWEKSIYTTAGAVAVHNTMADYCNSRIGTLNDRHPNADLFDKPDSPESKAYLDDVIKLENEAYASAVKSVHGYNATRTKEAVYVSDESGARIEVRSVKHSDLDEKEPDLVILVKQDSHGRVIEMNQAVLEMEHSGASQDFFAHYGKKGMKWGVRKDEAASKGGSQKGPTSVVVTQKKPGKFAKTSGGERHEIHEDSIRALASRQVAKKSTTDALSNAELRTAIDRMQLERKFAELEFSNDRRSHGARFVAGLFGRKKPTKYKDLDEELGEKTRTQVKSALAARAAMKAATVAI